MIEESVILAVFNKGKFEIDDTIKTESSFDIDNVKTAFKVADIVTRDDKSQNKIKVKWSIKNSNVLTKNTGRVYLIVVDKQIYKIGGSQCKGGIKSTIDSYINALTGHPSPNRYGIHLMIREELNKNKKVEIYMIESPKIKVKLSGLFNNYNEKYISAYKEMESICLKEYKNRLGNFPIWNFQESNKSLPQWVHTGRNKLSKKIKKA
mgnify:CR=1 FL=1